MLPNGRRIGAHLPLGSGMVKAADRAAVIGASAIQVFSDNPTAWRRRPSLPEELAAFRARLDEHGIAPIAIHAPYLVNLAGPEPAFHEQSVAVLANELRVAAAYGAAFVNVHIGSHRGEGVAYGVERLVDGIARVFDRLGDPGDVTLVLENSSGGGFGLGVTVEELARIEAALHASRVPSDRVGWCLDTAHLWGAGYAIDRPEAVDEVLGAFDTEIGLDRLRMVHLNDSRSELGSRSDRHEHVGAGRIGAAGLARMLEHPGLEHVAYYLETPGMEEGYDAINLHRAKALVTGEPLAELPPGAFNLPPRKRRSAPPDPEGDDPAAIAAAKAARPRRAPKPTPPPRRDRPPA
ncbi:MAG TPA: deoxyribonuclease IV [Candidatus Limnocylindrales bacterium]|nr:deoxyribonuclease IV [Candidatus Limnocylindrales bacterium]